MGNRGSKGPQKSTDSLNLLQNIESSWSVMLDDAIGSILGNNVGQRYIKAPIETSTNRNPLDLGLNPSSARSRSLLPYKRPRGAGQGCWSDGFFFWVSWDVHGVLMAFLCWYPALLKTPVRWLIGNFKHALIFSTPVGKRSYDHFWPLLDAWHNFWNWVTQAQTNWVPSHFSCPGSLVLCHGQKKVR